MPNLRTSLGHSHGMSDSRDGKLLPSPKSSASPLQPAGSRYNTNVLQNRAVPRPPTKTPPAATAPTAATQMPPESSSIGEKKSQGRMHSRTEESPRSSAATRPRQVPVVLPRVSPPSTPTLGAASQGDDAVEGAFRRLLELLRSDSCGPLPSLPMESEVRGVPFLWDCFQEAKMVKEAGRGDAASSQGATRQPSISGEDAHLLRLAQKELHAAYREISESISMCDNLQRQLDDSLLREEALRTRAVRLESEAEATSSRVRRLEAEVDGLQSIIAERDKATATSLRTKAQLDDALRRMEALEVALASKDARPPSPPWRQMRSGASQTPWPATCSSCVQAAPAVRVADSQTESLPAKNASCGTEDAGPTLGELEALRAEVAERRQLASQLIAVITARAPAPPPPWARIATLRVYVVRGDGLASGHGRLRCEARLSRQVESAAWTGTATCSPGGVCAWGDVVSMCVDGEVDAPQDLEVSVMHASREAERGVVGTLRVPILSIRQHTFDVAHTDDPDKWARLKLPLEDCEEREPGIQACLLIGLSFSCSR